MKIKKDVKLEWIEDGDFDKYTPCRQVYGICFNKQGEILIIRNPKEGDWQIPGGKPEGGESYSETLKREMREEANIEVDSIKPLGVQKVIVSKGEKEVYFQMRMTCRLKRMLKREKDPVSGIVYEKKFVPAEKVDEWVKWGEIGEKMFEKAIDAMDKKQQKV